jgi:hypothetical protein
MMVSVIACQDCLVVASSSFPSSPPPLTVISFLDVNLLDTSCCRKERYTRERYSRSSQVSSQACDDDEKRGEKEVKKNSSKGHMFHVVL